ncbi:MAG: hypothetical protein WEA10_08205 [Actinomycetota bacterium]
MRRLFWLAFGLAAGTVAGVAATRWTRKQADRVAPATLAREAKGGVLEFTKLLSESIEEGKRAMSATEEQTRADLEGSKRQASSDRRTQGRTAPSRTPAD